MRFRQSSEMFTKEPSGLILHAYKSLSTGHLWDHRYIQTTQDMWSSKRALCNARGFTVSSCMHYINHIDNCYVWDEALNFFLWGINANQSFSCHFSFSHAEITIWAQTSPNCTFIVINVIVPTYMWKTWMNVSMNAVPYL